MANEIALALSLRVANGLLSDQVLIPNLMIDQATQGQSAGILNLTTTAVALPLGNVTTPGVLVLQNLDATNTAQFGPDNSGTMILCGSLKPGESWAFRVAAGVTLKLKAAAGTPKVRYWLLED